MKDTDKIYVPDLEEINTDLVKHFTDDEKITVRDLETNFKEERDSISDTESDARSDITSDLDLDLIKTLTNRDCWTARSLLEQDSAINSNCLPILRYIEKDINTMLKESQESPISFAQNWEDPMVEINSIRNENPTICIIGGAGDTLCTIGAIFNSNMKKLDVVDFNKNQIFLCKLKMGLIRKYPGNFIKNFLTVGCQSKKELVDILTNLLESHLIDIDTYQFWIDNGVFLFRGLINCGRYEKLFQLANRLGYRNVFKPDNLENSFGPNATKQSVSKSFAEHFEQVRQTMKFFYKSSTENYFYHQMVHNTYARDKKADCPLYLSLDPVKIDFPIEYFCTDIVEHLRKTPSNTYDMIHFSNCIDWISTQELRSVFDNISRTLKPNGVCTIRRLNSDIRLISILSSYIKHCPFRLTVENGVFDKSHFYREVVYLVKSE